MKERGIDMRYGNGRAIGIFAASVMLWAADHASAAPTLSVELTTFDDYLNFVARPDVIQTDFLDLPGYPWDTTTDFTSGGTPRWIDTVGSVSSSTALTFGDGTAITGVVELQANGIVPTPEPIDERFQWYPTQGQVPGFDPALSTLSIQFENTVTDVAFLLSDLSDFSDGTAVDVAFEVLRGGTSMFDALAIDGVNFSDAAFQSFVFGGLDGGFDEIRLTTEYAPFDEFDFDVVSIDALHYVEAVDVSVPSPGPLSLVCFGLLGLGLRRVQKQPTPQEIGRNA